jgi:4-hydroxy-3-polyprenylbenzoate decarboxylase
MKKKKVVVAVTGASGSIYAKVLLDKLALLREQCADIAMVMSDNAKYVWKHELEDESYSEYAFRQYDKRDFTAPFASGSAGYDVMFICPCSMGTMGRIAAGISDDLVTRAADVMLKERRKLILLIRDTPYNLIHINNMQIITQAGGIICPATPSFYSRPSNFEEMAATVVDRALQIGGFELDTFRWGEDK